ncbi:LssY C-terminal domain-containing protein [Kocuria kalidii]|uniref:LssY C-terminal domain-containing protein n=1 Tax=Kocuria kalidii TaxID=3376283 RepID=UPI0037A232D0
MDADSGHPDSDEQSRSAGGGARWATVVLWGHRFGFLITSVLAGWGVYHLVLEEVDDDGRLPGLFLPLWVLSAYVLLPRLHRLLTGIYVPSYFIGRARTSDGLLGDPVNLAVVGTPAQLSAAMVGAGWTAADPLTLGTGWHIVRAFMLRRSYPAAPVSPLFAFGRRQSLAFEREVAGSPAQRHHVRFWICPPGWRLPGGYAVDLIGAATFDRRVGLSLFTLQITHKIGADTDRERDLVVSSLHSVGATVHVVEQYSTGYHARNGGGDAIETDGDLPIIDLGPFGVPGRGPGAG